MTDRDIIREVAERDPLEWGAESDRFYCYFCRVYVPAVEPVNNNHHDPRCLWVYCVEKMKERRPEPLEKPSIIRKCG